MTLSCSPRLHPQHRYTAGVYRYADNGVVPASFCKLAVSPATTTTQDDTPYSRRRWWYCCSYSQPRHVSNNASSPHASTIAIGQVWYGSHTRKRQTGLGACYQ